MSSADILHLIFFCRLYTKVNTAN